MKSLAKSFFGEFIAPGFSVIANL